MENLRKEIWVALYFWIAVAFLGAYGIYKWQNKVEPKEPLKIVQRVTLDTEYKNVSNKITIIGEDIPKGTFEEVIVYCLITEYGNIKLYDYGSAKEIDSLKCVRFKEVKTAIAELEKLNNPCK